MTKTLKVGLIGCGRIGKVHAAALQDVATAELVRVCDVYAEAAEAAGNQYRVPYSDNHHDVLMDAEVEAVLICSSTDTHAQFIVEAAEAGKHIFCEKPVHQDIAEIDRALAAVEKAGVKLMIGFNRRFDPNFRAVKKAIDAGQIGDLHILKITSRDPAPPPVEYIKVSGGLFLDMTVHDFDMARFLTNSEVEEVYVQAAVRVDPAIGEAGDVDTAIITLKMEDGTLCVIDNSRQAVYGYDQRVEAFGSKGMVQAENDFPNTHRLWTADAVSSEKPLHFFLERYMEAYSNEIREFVECVFHDTPVPVGGNDGRAPVLIGLACWKSVHENRPVKVSEIG
ncbi:MAG: myo-inositol 2-dehydrogenase/D-chiro-inositol 1-dehydrogenase [Cellvibrionaceae bacterium]|jgi:myo-inositol 2-dehydrogenase/D-chiro-inositol 1-dehydrogenase